MDQHIVLSAPPMSSLLGN